MKTKPGLCLALLLTFSFSTQFYAQQIPGTVIEFAGASTMFVADSANGQIFAFQLPPAPKAVQTHLTLWKQSTDRPIQGNGLRSSLVAIRGSL